MSTISQTSVQPSSPLGPIMDADTAPVMDKTPRHQSRYGLNPSYEVGQTVSFRYFRAAEFKDELYEGVIIDVKLDFLSGYMYRIDPKPIARFDLTPRWVAASYIKAVITEAHVDQLDTVTAINDKAMEWLTADLAGRKAEAARLSQECDAMTDAHFKKMFPNLTDKQRAFLTGIPASQTRQEGVSSPLPADKVTASIEAQSAAPVAMESKSVESVHPLARTVPGTAAHALSDAAALKAKRDQQHTEAKARVEARNGVYQHKPMTAQTMHSDAYMAQVLKAAK
jgi:hypothetical protein